MQTIVRNLFEKKNCNRKVIYLIHVVLFFFVVLYPFIYFLVHSITQHLESSKISSFQKKKIFNYSTPFSLNGIVPSDSGLKSHATATTHASYIYRHVLQHLQCATALSFYLLISFKLMQVRKVKMEA